MKRLFLAIGIILVSAGISPAGEPVMSDRDFFRALNLSLPALKNVKAAVDRKNYPKAREELIKHFRTRTSPRHGFLLKDWKQPEKPFDPTVADKVCKHVFTASMGSHYLGKRVDWLAEVAKNHDFTASVNRFGFGSLGSLDFAYRSTGNEKYAKNFVELITAWIEDAGLPKPSYKGMHPLWGSLTAALRTGRLVCPWHTFQDSPHFTPDAKMAVLKSMLVHGRWLASPHCRASGNWVFMISNSLAALGMVFPEFKESDKWVEIAFGRASEEYENQVYPDGMQQELTPHYHFVSTAGMHTAIGLAWKNNRKLPAGMLEIQEKMLEATMYLNMPDGLNPPVNDADLLSMRDTPATKAFNLDKASRWYKRQDMEYVGSGYTRGVRPRHTSYGLPYAGMYVMRSGWEPKARYLLFDAGPFGAGHTHEDALNIILHAYGRSLLFDSTNSRDGYKHTPFRWYQLKTESHNTIMVDGLGQCRTWDRNAYYASRPLRNRWVSAPGFDYAEGSYTGGYGNTSRIGSRSKIKAAHTRKIFFLKPDYWIVCDTVTGKGKHKIESLWHFTPGEVSIDNKTKSAGTQNANANLLILPADPANLSLRVVKGYKKKKDNVPPDNPDPDFGTYDMQGWGAFGQKNPAVPTPTAIYTSETALPYSAEMILYPHPTKQPPSLSVTKLKIENDKGKEISSADAVGLKVTREKKTDSLLISHCRPGPTPNPTKTYGDMQFDGRAACIREDEGAINEISMVDGAKLVKKGLTLVESGSVLDALDVHFSGTILKISLSNPHQVKKLTIYAPGTNRVELNGMAIPFKSDKDNISITPDRLSITAGGRKANGNSEKAIIVSHNIGSRYGEFSNKAGMCLEIPDKTGKAGETGEKIPVKITFHNVSLPPEAKVKVNVTLPKTPGAKNRFQWKVSDSPLVFQAPPAGGKITKTVMVKLISAGLVGSRRQSGQGVFVEAEISVKDKVISTIKAHVGIEAKNAKTAVSIRQEKQR